MSHRFSICVLSQLVFTILSVGLFGGLAFAQRDATVPNSDPEIERRSFQVAPGFEVNLFAADPLLAKPIQMNFDAAGRLWLATSQVYPQIKPGQKANDKIIVLEDTHGTGKADKVSVFADGLLIPTGVLPGDGGVYVANSTELLHFKDTDGDGKADQRRVILSGFGTEDTHHIIHAFRWGHDGFFYFNQSIYIHSHVETPHGVRRLGGGGIWQFRPDTLELGVLARGWWNSWGHHQDYWGQSFATDGAGSEGIYYVIPGAVYDGAPNAERLLRGLNPGHPKYCSMEILSGRHVPPDWQGQIITNDFRAHRVCRFVLSEDGSGYASKELGELIKTDHPGFRPVDVKLGPDGAIYIADWYNPIIQHGEVNFRDPRRDHTHGRIWRVTAKGRPLVPRPKLVGARTDELLEALKSPEDWTRLHANRVLKERGPSVLPALERWVAELNPGGAEFEHQKLEGLWLYQALDVVQPELLRQLLEAKDAHARAAAVRVLSHWHPRIPDALTLLTPRVADEHPRVRLEAVRALGQIPGVRSMELAMKALDRQVDRFMDYGLWLTARELEPSWLPELQAGHFDFQGNVRHLLFAAEAVNSPALVAPLMNLVRAGKIPAESEERGLTLVANHGGPKDLKAVFALASAAEGKPAQRANLLTALARATRTRGVRPSGDLESLAGLFRSQDDGVRAAALRLAGFWKLTGGRPQLVETAGDPATNDGVRQAAVNGLALMGGPESREALERFTRSEKLPGLRMMSAVGLASLDLHAGAARAVEVLAKLPPGTDPAGVFTAFLQQKGGPDVLAAALRDHTLPPDIAKVGTRLARSTGSEQKSLVDALTRAGNLNAPSVELTPEQMRLMVADVLRVGNPARGEAVFRRKDLACLKCHAIGGAGGQVGPDLSSIGASAQVDYLIDSILLPNRAVKENYQSLTVATTAGKVFTGIKVRQTASELVLRDAEDQLVSIPSNSIEEQKTGGSLMPAGQADALTRAELVDLVRFLSELGKIGPYSVGKARVVRRWQVLEPKEESMQDLRFSGLGAAATGHGRFNWLPAYSSVSGTLPKESIPGCFPNSWPMGIVRAQLDVTSGGRVNLSLNSATALRVWLDGAEIEPKGRLELDLAPGVRTLTFVIHMEQRHEGLRCELEDVPGSPARVQIVTGK